MDLSCMREVAGLPNGGGVTIEKALERAPPPHIVKGVGLHRVPLPPCVSLGPLVLRAISERG
jgi:hypothetical protein